MLTGLRQESDCLNLIGTGSGLDFDLKCVKQDWVRSQKNQSPNASTIRFAGWISGRVERIEVFCDPNPDQYFHCVIQYDPNSVALSKYLIQSGLYLKQTLIKHSTAVFNAV